MWRRADAVVSDTVGGRAVLVDAEARELLTLNATGSLVWHELAQPRTTEELVRTVERAYPGVPAPTVASDVRSFLDDLEGQGLVTLQPTRTDA